MKKKEREIRTAILGAILAGTQAAREKEEELRGRVAYVVKDGDRIVGTMPDLCGFANCLIPLKQLSRRSNAVKKLIAEKRLSHWDYYRALALRIPCYSQAISVQEAGARAAVRHLKEAGYTGAWVSSRLD